MQLNKSFHFPQAWEKCPAQPPGPQPCHQQAAGQTTERWLGTEWLSWVDQAVDFKVKSWLQALTRTSPRFADVMSPPGASISHTVKKQFLCVDVWLESEEVTYLASRRHFKPTGEGEKKSTQGWPGNVGRL